MPLLGPEELPGQSYDAVQQCRLAFGPEYTVCGDGRVRSSLVRRHQERTDGVSDQEASGRGGNAVWEGPDLSAGEVCG